MRWTFFVCGWFFMTSEVSIGDTAYVNGKIYTGTRINTDADAFLIKDGRFKKIGHTKDIAKLAHKTIDLQGALVLPGFIEAHAHLISLGQSKMMLDLRGLSKEDIVDIVMAQAKKQAPDTWIKGRGWDQNLWPDKNFPHKNLLSSVKNPVYLRRVDGHAVWLNDAALLLSKIDSTTDNPQGGWIGRDKEGRATGVLVDSAMDLINKHVDKPAKSDLEHYLQLAMDEALSLGITSFHDTGTNADTISLLEEYSKTKKLKLRVYALLDGDDQSLVKRFIDRGPVIEDFLTIRGIKYFADGALGSRGAYLLENYHDKPDHKGLLIVDKNDLLKKTTQAINKGFQVATHAIGDGANRLVLDVYEETLKKTRKKNTRLRIEHAQLVDPQDHQRFKDLAVIASMQPTHCTSDMGWVKERIGESRIKDRAYPWRSLLNKGVVLAFGSDAPVENINPIYGIYAAVTRSDSLGHPKDGFMPEQKLTLKEALGGYYQAAAYAEFNEHQKGKIDEGFFADFVVFDVNILSPDKKNFLQAKPTMTVVGGEIMYQGK